MRLEADDGRPETSPPLRRGVQTADCAVVRERQAIPEDPPSWPDILRTIELGYSNARLEAFNNRIKAPSAWPTASTTSATSSPSSCSAAADSTSDYHNPRSNPRKQQKPLRSPLSPLAREQNPISSRPQERSNIPIEHCDTAMSLLKELSVAFNAFL